MASEKSQALYIPTDTCEEKSLKDKNKFWSKYFLVWILVALLIALTVGLCVQFWFPIKERLYSSDSINKVDVFDGPPLNRVELQSTNYEKQSKQTTDTKDKKSPPWHLDFLINPTRLCETWDNPDSETYQKSPEVKLLILVPSATDHFAQRNTIRKTWGSVAEQPHGPIRLGFVLGTTPNATEELLIRHESESFGDVIQADFADTFRNLTTKSVLMLKWVSTHCPHARYFLKTDDDTFVNWPVLASVLQKPVYDPRETFVGGYVRKGALPTRTPSEKHYVSEDDFPEVEFPPYAAGSAYVTTGPTAAQLFDASQRVTPFLPLEDIFITGLCADDIDARLVHEPSFGITKPDDSSWDTFSSLATAHSLEPSDMDLLWDQLTKAILEALNYSDSSYSSSDSSEVFSSMSMSNLFSWPESDYDSAESLSGSSSESMKFPPETKSIFDMFKLLKNQLDGQESGKFLGKELDFDGLSKKIDEDASMLLDLGSEEPIDQPQKKINKGNFLLNPEEERQVLEAINKHKSNSSSTSFVLYFK